MSIGNSRWDEVGYVISSRYRVLVLERLIESPATPSRIAADSDNSITHVSRALQQLRERSHVELLVSEDRKKGRVYGITDEGRALWETVDQKNLV
jgi:DNA-binding MarR family transcriptional regulator